MTTYLPAVAERYGLTAAYTRLVQYLTEVHDGMDLIQTWAQGGLAVSRLSELDENKIESLRQVLYSAVKARLEVDGLYSELDARGNEYGSISVYDIELEAAQQELMEVELLLVQVFVLPAFYKTGGQLGVARVYVMRQGESLEDIAERFMPGNDDGASVILEESPDFDTTTELTDDGVGQQLNIPYAIRPPTDLLDYNWVLDSQTGLLALGQGVTNNWEVVGIAKAETVTDGAVSVGATTIPVASTTGMEAGDLVTITDLVDSNKTELMKIASVSAGVSFTLDTTFSPGAGHAYTIGSSISVWGRQTLKVVGGLENYAQGIKNRVLTNIGSVGGFPEFGSRVGSLVGNGAIPPDVFGDWAAAEAMQAALADPRTESVLDATVRRDGDAVYVELVLKPINVESGIKVTSKLKV